MACLGSRMIISSKGSIGVGELDPERGNVDDCALDEVLRRHRSGDSNGQRTRAEELGLTFGWMQDVTAQQNVRGGVLLSDLVFER